MTAQASTVAGVAAVAAAAVLAGFGPAKLLAALQAQKPTRWTGLALTLAAAAAGLAVFSVAAPAASVRTAAGLGAAAAVLAATAIVDGCWLVIPDLYPALLFSAALVGPLAQPPLSLAAGAAVGGGLLLLVRESYRRMRGLEAMGLGDVKFMTAAGALLGPEPVLWVILIGATAGAAWGVIRARGALAEAAPVPFGAALAAPVAAALALIRLAA